MEDPAMAFDEGVAQRLREVFDERDEVVVEKKMFGGIAFMLNGHMCCGVIKDELMVRVGKERHDEYIALPHAREMDFTKRPLKGMLYVGTKGFEDDRDLHAWVDRASAFTTSLPPK